MKTTTFGRNTASRSVIRALLIVALLGAPSLVATQEIGDKSHPLIVFMTDYGTVDDSVAMCKGVMYSIAPDVSIVDLTHNVKPYSIEEGARLLYGPTAYFPAGTVFLVVIDPGVGSPRRPLVVKSRRKQYFVLPDNGLITQVEERDGIEAVREVTNVAWMLGSKLSSTFHGRDIFSPVAAHLWRGDDWTQVGPQVPTENLQRVRLTSAKLGPRGITGHVFAVDGPFGNLITDIAAEDFQKLNYKHGDQISVQLNAQRMPIPFMRTFSDVAENQPLIYIDSRGRIALAINRGNFARRYHIKLPASITIHKPGTD
jgi:S-adenosylmethionine hydrolase